VSWKLYDEECFAAAEARVCTFDDFSAGGKAFLDMFFSIRIRFMSVEFMVIPSLDKSFSRDGLKDLSHTWSTAYHQYIKNQSRPKWHS
jgi:hypothetical protein